MKKKETWSPWIRLEKKIAFRVSFSRGSILSPLLTQSNIDSYIYSKELCTEQESIAKKKITRSHGGLFTRIEFNGRRQLLLRLLGLDGSRLAAATGFCFIIAAINRFLLDLIDISDGRLFLLVGSDSTALLRTGKKKKKRLPRIT